MSWNKYEKAVESGPMSGFMKWFGLFVAISIVISVTGYALGWFGEAANVAQKEFGATAALHKYEWFIDQSTRIGKMDQDIDLFKSRVTEVKTRYATYGEPKDWMLDVRVQYNAEIKTATEDLVAVISQRNNIVRDYNAASSKFNWTPFKTRPDAPQVRYEELLAN
jgi:hypothetical protein